MTRRFAIADIHGCSKTLEKLLEQTLQITKNDIIYFLGDYIDKGKDSHGVLDYLIDCKNQGYNFNFILGNHEYNILETEKEYDRPTFKYYVKHLNKSPGLLTDDFTIKQQYRDFFYQLQTHIVLPDYILVHAGINFNNDDIFADKVALRELYGFTPDETKLNGKRILHGHKVKSRPEIEKAVLEKALVIGLDNGCVYNKPHKIHDYTLCGSLCAFNMDTFDLFFEKNCERD